MKTVENDFVTKEKEIYVSENERLKNEANPPKTLLNLSPESTDING